MEDALMESHRLSPKAKAVKNSTLRRRKRPPAHLRTAHLDEILSPVTTPTDEEVIHRIKHVAGEFMHIQILSNSKGLNLYDWLQFHVLHPQVPLRQDTFLSTRQGAGFSATSLNHYSSSALCK